MGSQGESIGRILVIDDEPSVGRVLEQCFTRRGYHVRYADGFVHARERLQQEAFDLVTLDIVMPETDGIEVLRWLRAEYPDLGVVMATALTDLDSVLEAMRLGAINYLVKPFNLHLISAEIDRAMERQRLIAENRSYQQELEHKVAERTREVAEAYERLRAAHGQLERHVRELEARDRLVHFQMSLHTVDDACAEIAAVVCLAVEARQAALFRRQADGALVLASSAPAGAGAPGPESCQLAACALTADGLVGTPETGLAVAVLYREDALGAIWVLPRDPVAAAGEEWTGALTRLGREAALALRGALVAEDLEGGALSVDGLEEIQ